MSDFEAHESIPKPVLDALREYPALKRMFDGDRFLGEFIFYERNLEDDGQVWHLVIVETSKSIAQLGVDDETLEVQFYHPISLSMIEFYCTLSEAFQKGILTLAREIEEEGDIHDHYGPSTADHGHKYGHGRGHGHGHHH